jgi:YD repeat-containing protein
VEHQLTQSVVTRNANDAKRKTTQTTHYRYDAFGRRVEKRDAFGATHFTWDGNRLLAETRGSKTITYLYEPDSFAPLAQIERATNAQTFPPHRSDGGLGKSESERTHETAEENPRQAAASFQQMMLAKQHEIRAIAAGAEYEAKENKSAPQVLRRSESENETEIAQPRAWRIHYYHNDHLGTPRELSREDGQIEWATTYKAWGNTLKVEWEQTNTRADAKEDAEPQHQPTICFDVTIPIVGGLFRRIR